MLLSDLAGVDSARRDVAESAPDIETNSAHGHDEDLRSRTKGTPMKRDEARALAQKEQLEDELLATLDRTRTRMTRLGRPAYGRYLELAALIEVAGVLMKEAVEADPDRARAWIGETVRRFEAFVEPPV